MYVRKRGEKIDIYFPYLPPIGSLSDSKTTGESQVEARFQELLKGFSCVWQGVGTAIVTAVS